MQSGSVTMREWRARGPEVGHFFGTRTNIPAARFMKNTAVLVAAIA